MKMWKKGRQHGILGEWSIFWGIVEIQDWIRNHTDAVLQVLTISFGVEILILIFTLEIGDVAQW